MNDKTHRKEKETKNGKYMFGSGKYNIMEELLKFVINKHQRWGLKKWNEIRWKD